MVAVDARFLYASEMEMGEAPMPNASPDEPHVQRRWGDPLSAEWLAELEAKPRSELEGLRASLLAEGKGHFYTDVSERMPGPFRAAPPRATSLACGTSAHTAAPNAHPRAPVVPAQDYAGAIFTWRRALRVPGEAGSSSSDAEMVATITSNIGSAHHFLGEFQPALNYYAEALGGFEKLEPTGRLSRWYAGGANRRRMEFVQQRREMATRGERPCKDEYLDENGRMRRHSRSEFEAAELRERERQREPAVPKGVDCGG